jgi:bifunctional enzyme CysN/CysC
MNALLRTTESRAAPTNRASSTVQKLSPKSGPSSDLHASTPIVATHQHLDSEVRILTCGSVDDGKSTLIGRLLWDASDLFEDQREMLRRSDRRVLDGKHLDYSLLLDGLLAEREQGITIDIAWRYFDHANRRFVIIDSPGHEQYTRNMASGASHADVAVMLVDARHGLKQQTRRHAAILHLFGVKRVLLAVNKMDLAEWSEARFRAIEADFKAVIAGFAFEQAYALPVAAVTGDNVARSSAQMPWYTGPTLLAALQAVKPATRRDAQPFRFPVQTVLRDGQDFRGLAGTVTSGRVALGDTLVDVLSGKSAKVTRISTMDGDLASAIAGQAVALVLDTDLDISRGAVLAAPTASPVLARKLEARLVWLADTPFDPDGGYIVRTATDSVPVARLQIDGHLDLETMTKRDAFGIGANDIAFVSTGLNRAVALDTFAQQPTTGSFLLLDAITGATVAGGIVDRALSDTRKLTARTFTLTRDMLSAGLCQGLGTTSADTTEFNRRTAEAVSLLERAGVAVTLDV